MTAPLDEARLRDLTEWHQERTDEAFRREAAHDEADAPSSAASAHQDWQFHRDAAATILALLDALSAERERGDRAVEHLRAMSHVAPRTFEVEAAFAFLATQKAEGAET